MTNEDLFKYVYILFLYPNYHQNINNSNDSNSSSKKI